ncbi:hypothetical protein NDU88_003761 [Pleurodeles waltl]|uniref:Uncharacterized protein n=1 Tax=Pleurodeles waltl TaxID=8319 RepID=A0AAV7MUD7_PLEWA|nr:hypothetical protein NDU88_003761 [Pleurodeles waltl]
MPRDIIIWRRSGPTKTSSDATHQCPILSIGPKAEDCRPRSYLAFKGGNHRHHLPLRPDCRRLRHTATPDRALLYLRPASAQRWNRGRQSSATPAPTCILAAALRL